MTINEYQKLAVQTRNVELSPNATLQDGIMGLNGEAGECIDILKKHLFQNHNLDCEHIARELGDVAWYLALTAYAIGYDLETILRMNIEKVQARYPNGFVSERSINREKDDI